MSVGMIYRCYDAADGLLYVGMTGDWIKREKVHARNTRWWSEVARVSFENCADWGAATVRDVEVIQAESPRYNVINNKRKPFIAHEPVIGFYVDDDGTEVGGVAAVAEFLGITKGAVRDAVARGKLIVERRGGTQKKAGYLLFRREDVIQYKDTHSGKRGNASPDYPRKGKGDAK
jgi:hypothetical protein